MRPTIKIFIASSAEVKDERDKCLTTIHSLNKSHAHLDLEPILWEYEMTPGSYFENKNIQDAINPKLKDSHFAVFIFYSRIGQYTREEFDFSTNEKKKLLAYFKTGFSLANKKTIKTNKKLIEFKESLNDSVLYKNYAEAVEFEKLLYENLNQYLAEKYPPAEVATAGDAINNLSKANLELIQVLNTREQEIKALRAELEKTPGKDLQLQ